MKASGVNKTKLPRKGLHDVKKDDDSNDEKDSDMEEVPQIPKEKDNSATPNVKQNQNEKKNPVEKDRIKLPLSWITGFIIILALILAYPTVNENMNSLFTSISQKTPECNKSEERRIKNEHFMKEMKSIIAMLKNTESNLIFVNRSLTIFINEEEPEKPAIFLLLGTNSSACQLCICTWKFVEALQKYYNVELPSLDGGYIPAVELENRDGPGQQVFIENSIEEVVQSGKRLIVFEDIDRYSNSSLSKIHAYLDHENPPHKNVVYILTSITSDEIDPRKGKLNDLERIARKHFDDRWLQYHEDHRRALMGRLTSVVGLIHKGTQMNELFKHEDINENIKEKCQDRCKV